MGYAENKIEGYLVNRVENEGGICPKLISPSMAGWPDRVVILYGCVVFVEVKRPQGTLQPIQKVVLSTLQDNGANVAVVKTQSEVDDLIDNIYGGKYGYCAVMGRRHEDSQRTQHKPQERDFEPIF